VPPGISPLGVNIYLDESGDLGYPNGSDFFVFGGVIVKTPEDEAGCKKHVSRAKRKIWDQYKFDELKSSNLHDNCRRIVVNELLKGTYDFAYSLLRKNEVKPDLRDTSGLYNWLAAKLVEEVIIEYGFKSDVNVIIDKSLYGVRQHEFNQTLLNRNFDRFNRYPNHSVKIFHCNSKVECGIQIADIVAGTVYRHYARYNRNPAHEYNFFPQVCERTKVALDFFKGRRK
jgi:Protein of unknown function (DUF3800)